MIIIEDYVSFETAKLLKEKGFYGECMSMYVTPKPHAGMGNPNEAKIAPHGRDSHYYDGYLYQCEAPTLQMAMKWLRKEYKIIPIVLTGGDSQNPFYYWFRIDTVKEGKWEDAIYREDEKEFPTHEQASEAAIKYCLENLI